MKQFFTLFTIMALIYLVPSSAFGQFGSQAINYGAGANFATIADDAGGYLDANNNFTIEMWVKTGNDVQIDQKLFSKSGNTFPLNGAYVLGIVNGVVLLEIYNQDSIGRVVNSLPIETNRWLHIAAGLGSDGKMRMYINGVLEGEADGPGGNSGFSAGAPVILGGAPWFTTDKNFLGQMDEVRFWFADLSGQEINDWMLRTVNNEHPSFDLLTLYHVNNESGGTNIPDLSPIGANNFGTLSNASLFVASKAPFAGSNLGPVVSDTVSVDGVWEGKNSGTAGILTLEGTLADEVTVVFGTEIDEMDFFGFDTPAGFDSIIAPTWTSYTQGSPEVDFTFDLTNIDISIYDSIVLVENDLYGAGIIGIAGNLSGNSFTVADYEIKNNVIYTLAFRVRQCAAGNISSPAMQTMCGADATFEFTFDDNAIVPAAGGYILQFLPGADGTGANGTGFTITAPQSIVSNSNLGTILSDNNLPPMQGTWVVDGIVVFDLNDVGNSICGFTDQATLMFSPDMELTSSITDESVQGLNDGAIDLGVTGGMPGYTFSWSNNETTEDITGLSPGTYEVTVTDIYGCEQVISQIVEEGIMSSVEDLQSLSSINIFPNPTSGMVDVKLELSAQKNIRFQLYNVQGKLIQDFDNQLDASFNWQVDLSDFSDGIYFARFISDNEVVSRRIIKN